MSGTFERDYTYKVEPVVFNDNNGVTHTRLRADHTLKEREADAPSVVNYPYILDFPICMDLSLNRIIDEEDLVAWVEHPTDFNLDSAADEQDLIMLLDTLTGSVPP